MDVIATIIARLNDYYGEKKWERWREPVGELVRTILSQNTTFSPARMVRPPSTITPNAVRTVSPSYTSPQLES